MKDSKTVQFDELGTEIFLKIIVEEDGLLEKASYDLGRARKIISEKKDTFNRFNKNSELCRLNKSLFRPFRASKDLLEVIRKSVRHNQESSGLFDPRIVGILEEIGYREDFKRGQSNQANRYSTKPRKTFAQKYESDVKIENSTITLKKRIDLGGMVKGWIADQIATFLRKQGWKNFLVDLGGDMFAAGISQHEQKWIIAVEGVSEKVMQLSVKNKGIATSGITRRSWVRSGKLFHHLVNPERPNFFTESLLSVTVVNKNTESADVWAKTLFLLGQERGIDFANRKNIACLFLPKSGRPTVSQAMQLFIN